MTSAVQIRRDTASVIAGVTPLEGELAYATDTKRLSVGDGLTPGGTSIANAAEASPVETQIHAAAGKTTPVDADEIGIVDSAASNVLKKLTWANAKATIWTALGALISGGTGKTTPVDADTFALSDSAASSATKKLTWANLKAGISAALGPMIVALTAKNTPIDADSIVISDSSASDAAKKVSLTNFKAYLKTYLDTLYLSLGGGTLTGGLTGTTATFSGLVDLSGVAAGQIKFPAADHASSDANTLDDYEEGTCTPIWVASGNTFSYAAQNGTYTKVGNRVSFEINIQLNTTGNTLTASLVTMDGLPFAVGGTVNTPTMCNWINLGTSYVFVGGGLGTTLTIIQPNVLTAAGVSLAPPTSNAFLSATAGSRVRFSGTYRI